jgi:hypothetical protein
LRLLLHARALGVRRLLLLLLLFPRPRRAAWGALSLSPLSLVLILLLVVLAAMSAVVVVRRGVAAKRTRGGSCEMDGGRNRNWTRRKENGQTRERSDAMGK